MKKFIEKPHNLLFIASAVILLQFLSSVIYFFMQVMVNQAFDELWSYVTYIIYFLAVCAVSGIFIFKSQNKQEENKNIKSVKIWFSGFFLYAVCEILLLAKMLIIEYGDSEASVSNLWDNQHLYRLFLCIAVIFLIYCVLYIFEKKKIYSVFAGINLVLLVLFIMFVPDISELLLVGDENVFAVIYVVFVRESGIVLYMLNMFGFALYELYNYKEK